ncbi:guanine deaminase [Endozoicomonas gorgoniicola]|uniref:Guanine deaminase n=1 Tax=Endozoicomonas gorgoniicola TaxID=1234144 RepID=A0ABT3MVP9_9GAMM|nr:guanine deaminase [Endozoicomonas gorgoniicola]MCW7553462.1 guanine deaminase [Endozoicomonas gorgoniicola]
MNNAVVWKASVLHFLEDPDSAPASDAYEYFEDGALLVVDGHVLLCGAAQDIMKDLPPGCEVRELPGRLIVPGFIDTHVHYPQLEVLAGCGVQLLDWLNQYTFPAERRFSDREYADEIAGFFLDQSLSHGTTTSLVFGTVDPTSVDAFFAAAQQRNLRMIAGKVLMDRHAPDYLLDTAEGSYEDCKALIQRWHGKDRLAYAVTPRFAPTSTPEQLQVAGRLLEEHEGLYLHTHLSENPKEIEWVQELFPSSKNYLDVYDQHGLLGPRSIFAHSIHLCDQSWERMGASGSSIAFCPGSNLFLGSGLFNLGKAKSCGIPTGLGSDVGGGTDLCLLHSMKSAYQVSQLREETISPLQAFYLATLGGARALHLSDRIGSFRPGNEADFVVLNPEATPMLRFRSGKTKTLEELLGVLMVMGDDRVIESTVIMGQEAFRRD